MCHRSTAQHVALPTGLAGSKAAALPRIWSAVAKPPLSCCVKIRNEAVWCVGRTSFQCNVPSKQCLTRCATDRVSGFKSRGFAAYLECGGAATAFVLRKNSERSSLVRWPNRLPMQCAIEALPDTLRCRPVSGSKSCGFAAALQIREPHCPTRCTTDRLAGSKAAALPQHSKSST